MPQHFSALIDSSNNTLIAVGNNRPAMVFLTDAFMDTEHLPRVERTKATEHLLSLRPETCPEWRWDESTRSFGPTNRLIITDDMRLRAVLAAQKLRDLSYATFWINCLRHRVFKGVVLQDVVYAAKDKQARLLKDANFDVRLVDQAPYVEQYAQACGIPLRQAAEEIILQADLYHDILLKSESLRHEIFDKIKRSKSLEELGAAMRQFRLKLGKI
jgi:hypothetical protein